jgi:hypothetical protein
MDNELKDKQLLEDLFYSSRFFFSYSSLSKLLYSPKSFYNYYVLGKREEKDDQYFLEGKIVHCLLLENGLFSDRYVIAPGKVPSDSVRDILSKVYALYLEEKISSSEDIIPRTMLGEFKEEIFNFMVEADFNSHIKDKDKRINKVITDESIDYFEYLKSAESKKLIDVATYTKCVDIVHDLREHPVMRIMGLHPDVYNPKNLFTEIEIRYELEDFEFSLKGTIDSLYIDHSTKTIHINDLKTTSKALSDFPIVVDTYGYWMQAAIYERLVRAVFKDKYGEDWKYVFTFVVVDKANQIYPFQVTEDTMSNWQVELQHKLREAEYHYTEKDFTLPYKFVQSQIKL